MRILALIGEPATGKSSIARNLIRELSLGEPLSYGLLRGTQHHKQKIIVFGLYPENEIFGGTDRLSMAVQPDAEKFLRYIHDWNIFFEGDRLGNIKFLSFCKMVCETKIISLKCSSQTKLHRHLKRNDTQSDRFLKSRQTKIRNITEYFVDVEVETNETAADLERLTRKIKDYLLT